jgi:protein-S-isoprenylcysteine O-methyltransferase Ste14
MKRVVLFIYGLVSYLTFFVTFLYAIGFVSNAVVPKSIDSDPAGALWPSLLVNTALLGLFGVQHSVMARPAFKRWWTQWIPAPIERSTYVLFASLALILLFWQWRPLPQAVWTVEDEVGRAVLWTLHGVGWALVLLATMMISHAHLFGVRQVRDHLKGEKPWNPGFQTPGLYRHVRHPIMVGFFIAFWATPSMSQGHLLFAAVTSGYILVALQLEERDLVRAFGERYRLYRNRVPMLVPRLRRRPPAERTESVS